jgi:hypothetical protein
LFITNKHWHGVMQKSRKTKGTDIEAMDCDNIVQDKVLAEVFLNLQHLGMLSPGNIFFEEINLTHQCKTRLHTVACKTKLYYACVMSLMLFKPVLYFSSKACSSQILQRNTKKGFFRACAYKLNERLVVVGPDIDLGIHHLTERLTELNKLLLAALPRQVSHVQHPRRRLRVPELGLRSRRSHLAMKT